MQSFLVYPAGYKMISMYAIGSNAAAAAASNTNNGGVSHNRARRHPCCHRGSRRSRRTTNHTPLALATTPPTIARPTAARVRSRASPHTALRHRCVFTHR